MANVLAEFDDNVEEISFIKKKRKVSDIPFYFCMGENMPGSNREIDTDKVCLVFQNLSASANWLWWGLVNVRDRRNNICFFKAKNNIEAKKITKAFKELNSLGLIKRIQRQKYIINPDVLIPSFEQRDTVLNVWKSIEDI